MTSYRFFASCLFATLFLFASGGSARATDPSPTLFHYFPIEIRQNGVDIFVGVLGNHMHYPACVECDDPSHRTFGVSTGVSRTFDHIHVDFKFTGGNMVGYKMEKKKNDDSYYYDPTQPITFTVADVRAYWDNQFALENRVNVEQFICDGSVGVESAAYNCFSFAFFSANYNTWIQAPSPIYEDDYEQAILASGGDVIRVQVLNEHAEQIDSHAMNAWGLDYSGYSGTFDLGWIKIPIPLVIYTFEKFRSSGIYTFEYYLPGLDYDDLYSGLNSHYYRLW